MVPGKRKSKLSFLTMGSCIVPIKMKEKTQEKSTIKICDNDVNANKNLFMNGVYELVNL